MPSPTRLALVAGLALAAFPRDARAEPTAASFLRDRQRLDATLVAWSAGSVLTGTAMVTASSSDKQLRYAGIQTVTWGAIDGVIAGLSIFATQKSIAAGGAGWADERRAMAKIFFINAALDVAYIAVGASLWSLGKTPEVRGSGAGIVPQGGFLLMFDALGGVMMSVR